jgi:hypothetical protein
MSPRRRGRGRGNGSAANGPVVGADVAAAPSANASTTDVGPLVQDVVTAVERSAPAVSSTSGPPRAGSGFGPNRGLGQGQGRGRDSSRGADSRRPFRAGTPSVIAPNTAAATEIAPNAVATGPQQDSDPSDPPIGPRPSSCTLAQMRRFIKSRPYVPVHELRRRFLIDGIEDDVSPVVTAQRTVFVGLPPREAQFLSDLIRGGEVGCEMLLDPTSPGVVGVYPMRPVARQ